MGKTEIFEKIVKIIADQLSIPKESITEQSTLESLGADSLDRFEFVMKLEEEFGISIKDEDAEKLLTVGDVVTYISRVAQKS